MNYSQQVADQIRASLKKKKLSQDEFFIRMRNCGYEGSAQKIKTWLLRSGNRIKVGLDDLPVIARALGVKITDLLP